jgi:hypothetical protein
MAIRKIFQKASLMPRKFAATLISLGFLSSSILFPTPANAIFGLSKCDKVKSSIKKEEEIQKYAWKNYDEARDLSVISRNMTFRDFREHLYRLTLVWKSDLEIFRAVKGNPNCFKAETIAGVREKIRDIESAIKKIEYQIQIYADLSFEVQQNRANQEQVKYLTNAYKSSPKSWLLILK